MHLLRVTSLVLTRLLSCLPAKRSVRASRSLVGSKATVKDRQGAKLKIVGYLRGDSPTDRRIKHVGDQLGAEYRLRTDPVICDLAIQHGYRDSGSLGFCQDNGIPCIITEIGVWQNPGEFTYGWGYNGLNGLAFVPEPPAERRCKPDLKPYKGCDGITTVFGQTPGDKALRGCDIYKWALRMLKVHPGAEYRPHPMLLDIPGTAEPLEDVFARTTLAVTYSSTTGAEALIEGISTYAEHPGSYAYQVEDREEWLHRLSYRMIDMGKEIPVEYILSGYEEALSRAEEGIWDR